MGESLILASRSPQRRAILEQLGIEFEVRPADVPELAGGVPAAVAEENARRKALAIAADAEPGRLVLGVDTLVSLGTRIFGKPDDPDGARATLEALSGRTHHVISGLAVARGGTRSARTATATTAVVFRLLDEDLLRWYVETGEWRDRAGGYAIQGRGAALVERIEGDYPNVVGLPVPALLRLAPELLGRS
jgi:septum formation protein